jgi:hypothetical protein
MRGLNGILSALTRQAMLEIPANLVFLISNACISDYFIIQVEIRKGIEAV